MQYQVLARKYRPQFFHEIVGQEHVSRTLLNALQSGRVAHAFLFSGPRGSGKTTAARILAKALNCHGGKPGEPCGKCPACTEITAGNCMDVLEMDAASRTGVDDIRQVIEDTQYSPARDRHKIFIIDEVHMLSTSAFNALLKTLEEPPPHVIFVMATTEYHKIPPTILSRCQQHNFKLIPFPMILERLRAIAQAENVRISDAALEQVAFSSGGSMRDAMSALDQVIAFSGETVRDEDVSFLLGLVEPKILGDAVRAIARDQGAKILEIVADQVESGQDLQNFSRRLLAQVRNLMVLKTGVSDPAMLGIPASLVPDLRKQADLFSREDLLRIFDAFLRLDGELRHATQIRFELEMGLLELAHIARLRSLEELIVEFQSRLEGNPASGPAAAPPARGAEPVEEKKATPSAAPAFPRQELPDQMIPAPVETASTGAEVAGVGGTGSGLMSQITARVQKPSLESSLMALSGAEIRGGTVVLMAAGMPDFHRNKIKQELGLIGKAVSEILGSAFTVRLEDGPPAAQAESGTRVPPAPRQDPLERAKREPVVRSFLEMFPGPVEAEDIDS